MRRLPRITTTLAMAAATAGLSLTALPAAHAAEVVCSSYLSSDSKYAGVACDMGSYYVVATACSPSYCTQISGPVVNAPNTSWAYAGSLYFTGEIQAVFV